MLDFWDAGPSVDGNGTHLEQLVRGNIVLSSHGGRNGQYGGNREEDRDFHG